MTGADPRLSVSDLLDSIAEAHRTPMAAACDAYAELHEALAAHGICVDISALRADVTCSGEPIVHLGRVTAAGARRLAKALRDGWTLPDRRPDGAACMAAHHEPTVPPLPAPRADPGD